MLASTLNVDQRRLSMSATGTRHKNIGFLPYLRVRSGNGCLTGLFGEFSRLFLGPADKFKHEIQNLAYVILL